MDTSASSDGPATVASSRFDSGVVPVARSQIAPGSPHAALGGTASVTSAVVAGWTAISHRSCRPSIRRAFVAEPFPTST